MKNRLDIFKCCANEFLGLECACSSSIFR